MAKSRMKKYFKSGLIFHSPIIYTTEAKYSALVLPDLKSKRNSRILAIFLIQSLRALHVFCKAMQKRLLLQILLKRTTKTKLIKCCGNTLAIDRVLSSQLCGLSSIESKAVKRASGWKSNFSTRNVAPSVGANAVMYHPHGYHYEIAQTWCNYTHTHSMFSNCQHGQHGAIIRNCISTLSVLLSFWPYTCKCVKS